MSSDLRFRRPRGGDPGAFQQALEHREGPIVPTAPLFIEHGARIAELAISHKLPAIDSTKEASKKAAWRVADPAGRL